MPRRKQPVDQLLTQIGARIRFLRLERGLSLRKLSQDAKCSAGCISQIELGRSSITTKTLRGIARALKVQPFDLLNYDTDGDDVGYVIEKMRQDPSCVPIVREGLNRAELPAVLRGGSSVPASC